MDDKRIFAEKYRPKKLSDVVSNNLAINRMKLFVQKNPGKRALMIHGPSGSGKTCSVHALANDAELEVVEINASDYRNKDGISSIVKNASLQKSLVSKSKIILIDEADGLAGNEDRGGIQELSKVIDESNYPIILTVNDPWDSKLNILRAKSEMVEFNKIDYRSIFKVLQTICSKEMINADEAELMQLAKRVDGDLRAAINDLQTLIQEEIIDINNVHKRQKKESIFTVLKTILAGKDVNQIFSVIDNGDVDQDELFLWLDENIAGSYTDKKDLARAYDVLSKADVYRGRIRRQQYWRLLVYTNAMMNVGVALSKKNDMNEYVKYKKTTRLLKMWKAKAKNAKKKIIAEKFANATHTSVKKAVKDFEFYRRILDNKAVVTELKIEKEEMKGL